MNRLSSLIMVPEVFVCFFNFYFYLSVSSDALRKETGEDKKKLSGPHVTELLRLLSVALSWSHGVSEHLAPFCPPTN